MPRVFDIRRSPARPFRTKKFQRAMRKRRGKPGHPMSATNKAALIAVVRGRPRPDMVPLAKALAKKNRGSFWVNNGTENRLLRRGQPTPAGFVEGRLMPQNATQVWTPERREKLAAKRRGKPGPKISRAGKRKIAQQRSNTRWITNGEAIRAIPVGETPPPGWVFGMKLRQT